MALQFDENSDMLRYYMDGTLVFAVAWGASVKRVDCIGPGKRWSLGHSHPGYTYGAPVETADMRFYHHGIGPGKGGPLTAAEVLKLARAGSPFFSPFENENYVCLAVTDPRLSDSSWEDSFGHGCRWYHVQSKMNPALCKLSSAARECPNSCKSKQECFERRVQPKRYFAWDRTRLFNGVTSNGTICLGSHLNRQDVLTQCEAWVTKRTRGGGQGSLGGLGLSEADDKFLEPWLTSMSDVSGPLKTPQPKKGNRVNLTECNTMYSTINEFCDFDIEQVRQFTKDVKANGGDFTIAFWVKPLGDVSQLGDTGRFFPHINFLSTLSPPQHNLHIGYWVNPNGEVRINSKCPNRANRWTFFFFLVCPSKPQAQPKRSSSASCPSCETAM